MIDKIELFLLFIANTPTHKLIQRHELKCFFSKKKVSHRQLSRLTQALVNGGVIISKNKDCFRLVKERASFGIGKIFFTRGGNAYIQGKQAKKNLDKIDIFIPSAETNTALPGDIVVFHIKDTRSKPGKLQKGEGSVRIILKHVCTTVSGAVKQIRGKYWIFPSSSTFPQRVMLHHRQKSLLEKRITAQLRPWNDRKDALVGDIIEEIGSEDDPSSDTISVIKSHHLPEAFPQFLLSDRGKYSIKPVDMENRLDIRDKLTFTIDPQTAKDHDDAISWEKNDDGNWLLGIHIADVSHFVPLNSPLDEEARNRGTSVYFPDKVLPMLPEYLSHDLCSLTCQDRLSMSIFITFNAKFSQINTSFHESVIRCKYQLSYAQVQDMLDQKQEEIKKYDNEPLVPTIRSLHKLTSILRKNRLEQNSLSMDVPEPQFIIDKDGNFHIERAPTDEAHQIVEECMLLTNEIVCNYLYSQKVPQIYRVHDEPNPEKLAHLEAELCVAGMQVKNLHLRKHLQRFLASLDTSCLQSYTWNIMVLRSMKRAEYSTEPTGHYGLGKEKYAHFTSPIRRYPDLITHRILKTVLRGKTSPYHLAELDQLSHHCSEREKIAVQAERDAVQWKIMRFFLAQIERGSPIKYNAIIVDIFAHGIYVDIPEVPASGMIPLKGYKMHHDTIFDPVSRRLKNKNGATVFSVGNALSVIIAKVDMSRRWLDFSIIDCEQYTSKKRD